MSEQRILGISGRKQAGKSTCANFLVGVETLNLGIVSGGFYINEHGQLIISDLFGNEDYAGHLDLNRSNPEFIDFLNNEVNPYVKLYSFADILKKDVCIKVLGLTHEQCFGSDDDKNSLTNILWENVPGVKIVDEDEPAPAIAYGRLGPYRHGKGPMTAREVMQYVGTDIFRRMYNNVWVDSTIRQVYAEDSMFAIIADVRFPNEVRGVKEAGGRVIRFTRNPFNDMHDSETALDKENFDWSEFDAVIDNQDMTIDEQNAATLKIMEDWDWAVSEDVAVNENISE